MTVFDLIDALGYELMDGKITGDSEVVLCANVRAVDSIEFVPGTEAGWPPFVILHDAESCR